MVAIAGMTNEFSGNKIIEKYGAIDLMVENSSDLFVYTQKERYVVMRKEDSIFSDKLKLRITATNRQIGICTSAGTIGHSLNFGNADAAIIVSEDISLADAVATEVGNRVKEVADIQEGINFAKEIEGIAGIVVIIGESLGAWGNVEFA